MNTAGTADDVVVHLRRPAELFTVDRAQLLDGQARTVPGIDELVAELLGRSRLQRRARVVVTLPLEQMTPGTAGRLQGAIRRYCEDRAGCVERDIRVAWRQGLRSLRSGGLLFFLGLLLSIGFLDPDVDSFWQDLLGNGVFLVIAWVGLWYPLDLLFFARQPLRREQRILEALSRMPVEVRPAAGSAIRGDPTDADP